MDGSSIATRRTEAALPALGPDPVLALVAKRAVAEKACEGHGYDDDTIDRLADVVTKIEKEIAATRATSLAGVLEKFRIVGDVYSFSSEYVINHYACGAVASSAFADLEQMIATATPRLGALFAEWQILLNAHHETDEEGNAAEARMIEIERQITSSPAQAAADLLVKARIAEYSAEAGEPLVDGEPDTSRDTLRSLTADLERMAARNF